MNTVFQKSRLIMSQRATDSAHRAIQHWVASHAGPAAEKAQRAISPQGTDCTYQDDLLHIETAKTPNEDLPSQSAIYSVHYSPDSLSSSYAAYALIIHPTETDHSPGVISVTIHEPHFWGANIPPWAGEDTQPRDQINLIFDQAQQQDNQQHRRRRRSNQPTAQFKTIQMAREAYGPVILLTPKGERDREISTLVQQYADSINITAISEAQQLSMTEEIPDNWLRQWLSANAVLVKDCYEAVNQHHPFTSIDTPQELQTLLETYHEDWQQTTDLIAHRGIMHGYLITLKQSNRNLELLRLLRDTVRNQTQPSPDSITSDTDPSQESAQVTPWETMVPHDDTPLLQAQQRVSTLEDQLKEEQQTSQELQQQVKDLQTQVDAYTQYIAQNGTEDSPKDYADPESRQSRNDIVLEAVTTPGRFPNLRFLSNIAKDFSDYEKSRPAAHEIIAALDTIDTLSELYTSSENGNIGSWKEYFTLPGWTYVSTESGTTMGKYPHARRFRDHERNQDITVRRHLTHRGGKSGLQIFFDAEGYDNPFVVAYIGHHLPYASNRS